MKSKRGGRGAGPARKDKGPMQGGEAAGNPKRSSTGKPERRSTGKPERRSTDKPERGSTGNPKRSSTDKPERGSTGNPKRSSTGKPERGSTGNPKRSSTGKPERGSTGNPKRSSTGGSARRSDNYSPMLYGLNPVMEALRAGRLKLVYIYAGRSRQVDEVIELAGASGVEVKTIHDAGFFDSRFPKGHQGVAGDMSEASVYSVDDLLAIPGQRGEEPLFLVLDGIEDPRNLGAVLRTAEAAGVHGVVMEKRRSAPIGPEAIKASAGAAMHIPVAIVSNIKLAMRAMSEAGLSIVGAEAGGEVKPWGVDLAGPVALVTGSEGQGLRRTVAGACDRVVSLPIRGNVNSLNTSVAASILIYEVLRQRGE